MERAAHRVDLTSARMDVSVDPSTMMDDIERLEWGDGLPIVPPTEDRVRLFVEAAGSPPDTVLATLAPVWAAATVEKVAINAVMAGCRPEYMKVLCAAVRAVAQKEFNLYSVQNTTHPCGVLLLVSGPVSTQLKMNSGYGAFGPGSRANGTIGRALRLILMNVGGARPGVRDRATQGSPCKFTYCVAENEAASPWGSVRQSLGFSEGDSVVTVVAGEGPHNINDHGSTNVEGLVCQIANTMATPGNNNTYMRGDSYLFLGPEHARQFASSGMSRDEVQRRLFQESRVPRARFGPEQLAYLDGGHGVQQKALTRDAVYLGVSWEDLKIVVVGGDGRHSSWVPGFGISHSCSEVV